MTPLALLTIGWLATLFTFIINALFFPIEGEEDDE